MLKSVVITGASSGLGACIAAELRDVGYAIYDWSLERGVNVTDRASLKQAREALPDRIGCLINCAGINAIDWMADLTEETWDLVLGTNAKGIYLTSQVLMDRLRGGTIVNIVSNASHVPMTNSLAYNASKGAAAIMTRQMARELGKTHDITVFGVSPNKLKNTAMSAYIDDRVCGLRGWTPDQARQYQINALPAGEETDPQALAEFLGFLLSTKQRHKYLAGCDIPYGA